MHERLIRRASASLGPVGILIGAVVLTLVAPLQFISEIASADESLPMSTVGFQSGTITAIYETSFLIDGRTFRLTPDAVLQDDTGKEIIAGGLVVTAEVKYHLKKGESDKIDRMVVTFPR